MTGDPVIPDALRERDQWICWGEQERDGKQTKVPLNPQTSGYASVTDPETWADFETAREAAWDDESVAGIGFVFTDEDSIVGIDLDDCRDPETGQPESWAKAIVDRLDSFTEVSPSGTGYHVYVRGHLPEGGNRSGNVECYDTARFFTVTGDHVSGTPTGIKERPVGLQHVHREYVAGSDDSESSTSTSPDSTHSLDDETLLTRAKNAKNGEKFSRLWRGDISGYDSHSEADMALCFLLAFWTGGDRTQMDRLFRQSGLYRQKWDETHYADGRTYGEGTISRAVGQTSEFYEPRSEEAVDSEAGTVGSHESQTGRTQSSQPVSSKRAASTTDVEALARDLDVLRAQLDAVPQFQETVEDITQRFESLRAQHEYLYEELTAEQERREQLAQRITNLEQALEARSDSWMGRLFD